jgi:hypothetical protein
LTFRRALAVVSVVSVVSVVPVFCDDYLHEAQPGLILPGGFFILWYDATGPLSYRTMRPRDVKGPVERLGPVSGRSCQLRLAIPLLPPTAFTRGASLTLAGGNGSFVKALGDVQRAHPGLKGVYDIAVDHHVVTVLGVFQRACTEVRARGFR